MILFGENTIELSPQSLMAIVQAHLRDGDRYSSEAKERPIRVVGMNALGEGDSAVEFFITTDKEPSE